jgi:hypothetical protein
VKLDFLENTIKEIMHTISKKYKLAIQRSHVAIVPEQTRINVPKHLVAHPWYHGLDNDCFMYSIHNVVKDEVPTQLVEEPSTDMMCMFDDISFHCWEEEDQLQFKQDSQSVYSDYDNNDQNAEDFRSCQSFQDPIVIRLDDLCCQNHFSFASHELKSCYDLDMVRQSASHSSSTIVLLLNLLEQMQPYHKLHEDENNIDIVLDHVVDLVEFKNKGTGQFYLDPIATYMEKFFTAEPQSISAITFVL